MKFTKKKVAAVALSAMILGCGAFTGCDFITADSQKDLLQVVAEVNITDAAEYKNEYAAYTNVISTSEILKRDMVASFVSVGYQYINNYGYSYQQTFDLIVSNLANRQIYMQYAKTYFLENDATKTVDGYNAAVAGKEGAVEKEIAGLGYFLTEEEVKLAEYAVRHTFNATIDSQETSIINAQDDHDHDETVRTTPTGIDTEVEDYYDEAYKIYTGSNAASACGSYETVEGSTPVTRRKAYNQFLASLYSYALIGKGEDTAAVEKLSYYRLQLKTAYEDALISKLSDAFENEAKAQVTETWVKEKYQNTLATQRENFTADTDALKTALDGISESSFVLYSPDENFGFVINILLPFSTMQKEALDNALADYGDKQGNLFTERAKLLKNIKATDQRKTWFTGETDYSFAAETEDNAFTNNVGTRNYLFFKNSLRNSDKYEAIPNYYGKYTYNGTVQKVDDEYVLKANKISIDGFLAEMENYLGFAGYTTSGSYVSAIGNDDVITSAGALNVENGYPAYYNRDYSAYYNAKGEVDYSSFVYYYGKVAKDGETLSNTFNANNVFVSGSNENVAMAVVNELSFAYNTDTAGLNTRLGYAVTPEKTDFVSEFEYASQLAVRGGAGTYVVAPSQYGWHIMYCTFSYAGNEPYTFNWDDINVEGTFSNLYYEALKSSNLSTYATDRQSQILNDFHNDSCITTYEKRYEDLYLDADANTPQI